MSTSSLRDYLPAIFLTGTIVLTLALALATASKITEALSAPGC